jgi:hypothetical protein
MKERILAIDDTREMLSAHVVARTYRDGIAALERLGPFTRLYLDHDISGVEFHHNDQGHELTGHDIVKWLAENRQYLPDEIVVVSGNVEGVKNMRSILKELYAQEDSSGRIFTQPIRG